MDRRYLWCNNLSFLDVWPERLYTRVLKNFILREVGPFLKSAHIWASGKTPAYSNLILKVLTVLTSRSNYTLEGLDYHFFNSGVLPSNSGKNFTLYSRRTNGNYCWCSAFECALLYSWWAKKRTSAVPSLGDESSMWDYSVKVLYVLYKGNFEWNVASQS